jgi:hypothetical protein
MRPADAAATGPSTLAARRTAPSPGHRPIPWAAIIRSVNGGVPVTAWDVEDPAVWEDLFTRDVDERPVQFVRPADTDRPTWAAYEGGTYLGTVSAEPDGGRPLWRVQTTHEAHRNLDDAVRALRRPSSWPREREQAARWARRLLADDCATSHGFVMASISRCRRSALQVGAHGPYGS